MSKPNQFVDAHSLAHGVLHDEQGSARGELRCDGHLLRHEGRLRAGSGGHHCLVLGESDGQPPPLRHRHGLRLTSRGPARAASP